MNNSYALPTGDERSATQNSTPNRAAILSLGTAVPEHGLCQADIGRWMAEGFADAPAIRRAVRSLHAQSAIERRYTCCPEYLQPVQNSRFAPGASPAAVPTTAERMAIYANEAPKLGLTAAHRAIVSYAATAATAPDRVLASITHLVVVSCTGFFAPGLDFVIAQQLGLASTVSRTVIGFMGCSAAFNGLRTAQQIVGSQPEARVLVVCVELCSLHIQQNCSPAHLIAMSLFADGAAACLVGKAVAQGEGLFHLEGFHTETQPDTERAMIWEIGDHGFVLHLSPQIPRHIAAAAPATLRHLFPTEEPAFWAIHPGGRVIVDQLQATFALSPDQVAASRAILRRYGNLSSATILFVLQELYQRLSRPKSMFGKRSSSPPTPSSAAFSGPSTNGTDPASLTGVAMAFGPGLVIEMVRLTLIPAQCEPAALPSHSTTLHRIASGDDEPR
ncbi:MAG TPA: type III polyketide synthase [Caldilineaceae bacterium]|nr:type III polyketide synthase [Caldilineaceae bacterium]